MISRTKFLILVASLPLLALSVSPALAQPAIVPVPGVPAIDPQDPTGNIVNFIDPFITMAITLIGTLAVIFLVYAGFKYISSRGDEEEAKRAKMQIAYAVIGIIVALGAYFIRDAILKTGEGEPEAGANIIIGILDPFITMAFTLVGIAAVIYLIYAGFKYISSRGDEEEAKKAKMQIAYAVVGITVALLAVAITNFVIIPLRGPLAPAVPGMSPLNLIAGIAAVVEAILVFAGIAAAIFLIYAGFKYISSTGDEEEANQAKRQIVYAIIGLTVVALSAAIVNLIINPLFGRSIVPFAGTYAGDVEQGIRDVVNALLSLVGIAAAIFLVYAGVKYLASQGNEEETNQAKRQIIYALIGLVIILVSAAIVNLVLGSLRP